MSPLIWRHVVHRHLSRPACLSEHLHGCCLDVIKTGKKISVADWRFIALKIEALVPNVQTAFPVMHVGILQEIWRGFNVALI